MKEIKDIRISNRVASANFQNVPADLKSKGIYFWFADQKGINMLLKPLDCKLFDKHYIFHEGQKLFLIYIGTAGTGKQKLSNLNDRFRWHLIQKHSKTNIRNKSLSNLRLALSLLLKTNIEGEGAAKAVNKFMEQHLYISWMPYENETLISTDEKNLIKTFFPFINDDHNDKGYKSSNEPHATKSFKLLKASFRENLKADGLDPINNQTNKPKTSKKMKDSNPTQRNLSPTRDDKGCFLIPFTLEDNLHEKVNQYKGINGAVILNNYSDNRDQDPIYIKVNGDQYRKTNNIYKYFQNPDTGINNTPRHILVQEEMLNRGIKNAILRVCPLNIDSEKSKSSKLKKSPTINSKNIIKIEDIDFNSMKGKPKLLILPCSGKKEIGQTLGIQPLDHFENTLNASRQASLNNYSGLFVNKPRHFGSRTLHYNNAFNNNELMPAIDRYIGKPYKSINIDNKPLLKEKIIQNQLHLLIVSGLYGLLRFDDAIIDYKLQVSQNAFLDGNLIHNEIVRYIRDNVIENSNVFFLLSPTSGYESIIWHIQK